MAGEELYVVEFEDVAKPPLAAKEEDVLVKDKDESPKPKAKAEESDSTLDAVKEAARAQGWVEKDEWSGNPGEWRDADVFLERGEYFRTMSADRKHIKDLEAQLTQVIKTTAKIRQDERAKVLKELAANKKEAIANNDYDAVIEIDKQIVDHQTADATEAAAAAQNAAAQQRANQQAQQADNNQLFLNFVADNPWYVKQPAMKAVADAEAQQYFKNNPNGSYEEMLSSVMLILGAKYPNEIGKGEGDESDEVDEVVPKKPKSRRSPVGESDTTTRPSSQRGAKKKTYADLPDTHKKICDRYVQIGAVPNRQAYVDDLIEIGEDF